tara:strand:- start:1487 stop:2557 length:1071 start_codon:yes stop_codon:yes gene_type:complete
MAYIGKQPGTGVRNRLLYTATAGQTTFTTSDSSQALSYSDSLYVDVYLNGVLLDPANDYTATSGTSIVLGAGASAGDVLEVVVYDVFSVFNNTIDGNFDVGGNLTIADKIVHSGDTNTAIRFPAADTVTVETAGGERLRVDDSGRVGIGESSPDRALDVVGNGVVAEINSSNSNALKVEFSDNGTTRSFIGASSSDAFRVANSSGTNLFNVTSAGLVGIPNLPAFTARGSGTQSFSGTSSLQVIVLSTANVNNGSDFNTTTGKFTCPVAGIYCFFGSVTTTAAATGVEAFIFNDNSGATIARVISYGDSFDQGVMIGIDDCSANDVISFQAINNNNTTFDIDRTRCNFGGVLLTAT